MPDARKVSVFLSYSREDFWVMESIRDYLDKAGVDVWVDAEGISPASARWQRVIGRAIENCDALLVILSPDSEKSEWVEKEVIHGRDHKKPIFPVLVRGDEVRSVPFALKGHQLTDIRRGQVDKLQRIVEALRRLSHPGEPEVAPSSSAMGQSDLATRPIPIAEMSQLTAVLIAATKLLDMNNMRACLFKHDPAANDLYIIAATPGFNYDELSLRFRYNHGMAGEVWKTGMPRYRDLRRLRKQSIRSRYSLTEREYELTKDINLIFAFPIFLDDGTLFGVLTIDSSSDEDSEIIGDEEKVTNLINSAQEMIGIILGVAIPDNPISYQRFLNIRNVLRVARLIPPLEAPLRVTMFFMSRDQKQMEVAAVSHKSSVEQHVSVTFRKGQGVVGRVWETGTSLWDSREGLGPDDMRENWDMTNDQIKKTSDVVSVIGVPIFAPTQDKVWGVLTVSSEWPLNKSQLDRYRDEFEWLAQLIARLLIS
jgi:hypothetical protein